MSECKCGHLWIEHHNYANITQERGFTTDTKECHFCSCKQFKEVIDVQRSNRNKEI